MLLTDLIDNNLFSPSSIVYSELLTSEKMQIEVADHQLGLRIFTVEQNLDRFDGSFSKILEDNSAVSGDFELITLHLKTFKQEEQKPKIVDITRRIAAHLKEKSVHITEPLFHDLVHLMCEHQQWKELTRLLKYAEKENSSV
jgi:hypothetical protein